MSFCRNISQQISFDDTIYRSRDKDIDSKHKFLIADAIELYNLCKEIWLF